MNHSLNLADLGRRVRTARLARRLTLEEVVSRTDFTVSWLSKLENGQLSPSLDGLVRVAAVLDCGVDSLVEGLSATPRHVVCRRGEADAVRPRNGAAGVTAEHLAAAWRGRHMEPTILTIAKNGGRHAPEVHPGERMLLVLEGDVKLAYGDDVVPLATGDSVYLDATVPHAISSVGRSARVLSVAYGAASNGQTAATPAPRRRSNGSPRAGGNGSRG